MVGPDDTGDWLIHSSCRRIRPSTAQVRVMEGLRRHRARASPDNPYGVEVTIANPKKASSRPFAARTAQLNLVLISTERSSM